MAIQSQYGKAFEYACLIAMRNQSQDQHVHVSHTSSLLVAQEAFNVLPPSLQNDMLQAADAAARVIIRLEPYLQHPNGYDPLHLILQEDAAGITGDVRDLIAIRNQIGWQIGISCKHNHNAVKHSRLSRTIDFGDRWFGIPCSPQYFDTITPIFDELAELRDNGYLWSQIHNKEEAVYIPILEA
ncbi:MAG: HaeIII family restriction endonuclease, partial [Clostridiaceae bacterium]|nr:HaeIII family restriction endonuclease [Clostridiaceae bacterium]